MALNSCAPLKVLTLTQPWAMLVAMREKRVETRSWRTSYRGPLGIHAAKNFPIYARHFALNEPCGPTMVHYFGSSINAWPLDLTRGHIIAVCDLVDCQPTDTYEPTERERGFGDYTPGRWAWLLENIEPIEMTQAVGALGLWDFPYTRDELVAQRVSP